MKSYVLTSLILAVLVIIAGCGSQTGIEQTANTVDEQEQTADTSDSSDTTATTDAESIAQEEAETAIVDEATDVDSVSEDISIEAAEDDYGDII